MVAKGTVHLFMSIVVMFLMLSSCGKVKKEWRFWEEKPIGDLVAEVGEDKLYQSEISSKIDFKGLSEADSLLAEESFVKNWITGRLLYDKAVEEVDDMDEIDSLVENYRRTMVVYEYELKLVNDYLSDKLSDAQMRTYYKENPRLFTLSEGLVKGMLLVVYSDVPDLKAMEALMENPNEDNIDMISSMSVKNAARFDYFMDKWVPLSDVKKNSPLMISEKDIQENKLCSVADSTYTVYFYVSEYKRSGDIQPYDYAQSRIRSILVEQNKTDFLIDYRKNLYEIGIKKGHARRYK